MNRRAVLRVGALAASTVVAGCTSGDERESTQTTNGTATVTSTERDGTATSTPRIPEDVDTPLTVLGVNGVEDTVAVEVTVERDGETLLEDRFEFGTADVDVGRFERPGTYVVAARTGDREAVASHEVGREHLTDCNYNTCVVAVHESALEVHFERTTMGCE